MVDDAKRAELRAARCKPIVDEFFEWLKITLETKILLPRNPFTEAAGYALAREAALKVFLQFPAVPIDTNHLEREIRPIAVGRKNWLFCWTEVGAKYVGIFQSLLVTCRLQGVDPYTYLVDVLQRVDRHPASDVAALTPRRWKERFADDPLCSARRPTSQERRFLTAYHATAFWTPRSIADRRRSPAKCSFHSRGVSFATSAKG